MKQLRIALIFLVICVGVNNSKAQKLAACWDKFTVAVKATKWTAGLGWNIVSDDGNAWRNQFDVLNTWNIPPYPTKLSLDGYFQKGLSFGVDFTYNNYKTGKIINGEVFSPSTFFAADADCKYNFCELYDFNQLFGFGDNKVFDFFAVGGFGYTYRNTTRVRGVATFNLGFGMNAWVYKNWGVQLEAQSKFGLVGPIFSTPANYLQYSFGVVYQFSLSKFEGSNNKPIYHLKNRF